MEQPSEWRDISHDFVGHPNYIIIIFTNGAHKKYAYVYVENGHTK